VSVGYSILIPLELLFGFDLVFWFDGRGLVALLGMGIEKIYN